MSDISTVDISDSTTDISQSSRDDSGIYTSAESETHQNTSQLSCSDVLAELLQMHKKLREAATQVRSLSLILEHGDAAIDHSVFQENKSSLEQEIMKIKEEICNKELLLQQSDETLFEYYLGSIKDEGKPAKPGISVDYKSKLKPLDISENEGVDECEDKVNINGSECSSEILENEKERWDLEGSLAKEHEIAKLRRTLTETRQKHKEERDRIMKQLKALQITTVQGETNWKCVLKEKQLKIDELTRKISELQTKYDNFSSSLSEMSKQKQEKERKKKKDEKIILSLRTQNSSINEEVKQLSCEVKELRNIKENMNESLQQLTARNEKLENDLSDKCQTVDEKKREVEQYSKEIKETNNFMNKLVMEVNCLNTEQECLKKQLQELTTKNYEEELEKENVDANKECSVRLGVQTEESAFQSNNELQVMKEELDLKQRDYLNLTAQLEKQEHSLKRCKENEMKLQKESEMWKSRSFQNERTIQQLTISLGKAATTNEVSEAIGKDQEIRTKTKGKFSDFLNKMLQEIRGELDGLKEDVTKYNATVSSLQDKWKKCKNSIVEMNEDFIASTYHEERVL